MDSNFPGGSNLILANLTKGKGYQFWDDYHFMPSKIIRTKEFECTRCKYKWVTRRDGIEKLPSKFCPRCKTSLWDKKRKNKGYQ